MPAAPNRLIAEDSPYLRQHAHNPVDWYPWGPEALERARTEQRPILLSIGYSACHWCHVMERESFEDATIAARMNELFVCVKVDREERPDLDTVYMNAVQLMTGSGGWPLTVVLTPEGEPFFGGTYFPPEDRWGRPGFPRILEAIASAWADKKSEIDRSAASVRAGLERFSNFAPDASALTAATLSTAAETLRGAIDGDEGGFGRAPKFPNATALNFLLRQAWRTGRADLLDPVVLTLRKMARGGIRDHVGGGFHRYSVDEHWLVPHFEKMLYDNAQLLELYADAHRLTNEPEFRRVAECIADYLLREMRHTEGGFFSTQDADTDGEEGLTYVWTLSEMNQILGDALAPLVTRWFQVDEAGNFAEPGSKVRRSILHVQLELADLAKLFHVSTEEAARQIETGRARLLAVRQQRPQPGRDEKVLASWNGLVARALIRAGSGLGRKDWIDAGAAALAFIDRHLRRGDGAALHRTWKDGRARYDGILDDHAQVAVAHLDLFENAGRQASLERALELAELLLEQFEDPENGGFFLTARDHEPLIDRPRSPFDGSLPSGNAVAVELFLRLHDLKGEARFGRAAQRTLTLFAAALAKQPLGTAGLVTGLEDSIFGRSTVLVTGDIDSKLGSALLRQARSVFRPGLSVVAHPGDDSLLPAGLRGRSVDATGEAAAWVCSNFSCSPAVRSPEELERLLSAR